MEAALASVTPHQWISLLGVVAVLLALICIHVLRKATTDMDFDPAEPERIEPPVVEDEEAAAVLQSLREVGVTLGTLWLVAGTVDRLAKCGSRQRVGAASVPRTPLFGPRRGLPH